MEGRNIAMIVDKCPAHPFVIPGLKATKVIFLHPKTRRLQPCDQGIIQSLKKTLHYRETNADETTQQVMKDFKISVLDARHMLISSWGCVVTIEITNNCFKHAGFVVNEMSTDTAENQEIGLHNEMDNLTCLTS